MKCKWLSRKFIFSLLLLGFVLYYKFIGKITDLYFTIIVLVIYLTYLYIQGHLDLEEIRSLKTPYFNYEKGDKYEH